MLVKFIYFRKVKKNVHVVQNNLSYLKRTRCSFVNPRTRHFVQPSYVTSSVPSFISSILCPSPNQCNDKNAEINAPENKTSSSNRNRRETDDYPDALLFLLPLPAHLDAVTASPPASFSRKQRASRRTSQSYPRP